MSQRVKAKRQANFKDFKRFGVFKEFVEQKDIVFISFVCKLGLFGTRGPLKRSCHSRFKINYLLLIDICIGCSFVCVQMYPKMHHGSAV
jgi:hypothetical protein